MKTDSWHRWGIYLLDLDDLEWVGSLLDLNGLAEFK